MPQPKPKFSFKEKTVTIPETVVSFDQIGMIEEMLNEQVIFNTCDKVDLTAAKMAAAIGELFGLAIDPNPDNVSATPLQAVDDGEPGQAEQEETYQVAG